MHFAILSAARRICAALLVRAHYTVASVRAAAARSRAAAPNFTPATTYMFTGFSLRLLKPLAFTSRVIYADTSDIILVSIFTFGWRYWSASLQRAQIRSSTAHYHSRLIWCHMMCRRTILEHDVYWWHWWLACFEMISYWYWLLMMMTLLPAAASRRYYIVIISFPVNLFCASRLLVSDTTTYIYQPLPKY